MVNIYVKCTYLYLNPNNILTHQTKVTSTTEQKKLKKKYIYCNEAYIFSLSVLPLEPSQHRTSYLFQNVHAEKEDTHSLFDGECSKINLHPRICPWPCQRSKHRTPCVVYFVYHPPGFFFPGPQLTPQGQIDKKKKGSYLIYTKKNEETCVRILFVLLMYLFPCLLLCLLGCRKLHTRHFR